MRWIIITIAAVLLVAGAVPGVARAKTIYVDADATGADNGTSWPDAYKFLQDGLADANASAKPVEIRVAQGVYRPDRSAAEPNGTGDRMATFQLINGVALRGGYAGGGQADPNTWDIEFYETVLSGDLDANDVEVNDPADLWEEPSRAENAYHVLTGFSTDESALLDGMLIIGGNANGWAGEDQDHGGGMYVNAGRATVSNCSFTGNFASDKGGGLYTFGAHGRIVRCSFERNRAKEGGGIYTGASVLTLIDCTLSDNTGVFTGGGGVINDGMCTLDACTFSANRAEYSGAGLVSVESNVDIRDCRFLGNRSPGLGAPWIEGGFAAGLLIGGGEAALRNCVFAGNRASSAGGMYIGSRDVPAKLTECTFTGNVARYGGGGIGNSHLSRAELTNCILSGNRGGHKGGAIYNERKSSTMLTNCTLTGNSGRAGGAIYNERWSSATLANSILGQNSAESGAQAELEEETTLEITYSYIEGGRTYIHGPHEGFIWGVGNIETDPRFAESGHWDPNATPNDANDDFWVDGDYHLKSEGGRWDPTQGRWVGDNVMSPCIDAGDPMSPIGNEPFPNGGVINMGAYGGTAEASKSYFGEPVCETIVAGDVNGDCRVDFLDFQLMALHWLEER